MLLTEYVEMSWNVSNREWYENLKYKFTKIRDKFLVSVNDLPPKSRRFVRLKCDFCGKEFDRRYSEYFRGRKNSLYDACPNCRQEKYKDTCIRMYGTENVFQNEDIKNKIKDTCVEKYGVENPIQDKTIKEKAIKTTLEKYGVKNVFELKSVQNKIRTDFINKYGVPYNPNRKAYKSITPFSCVSQFISDNGCELLSSKDEYIDTKTKLAIRCKCGEIFYTTYINFKYENKRQCNNCGIALRSGENHSKYNPNLTEEERIRDRKLPEYVLWRKSVYEKYNFTCQLCHDSTGGNLVAHHLSSWNTDKENRFNVDNGICLCDKCHKEFHTKYEFGNNTKEQFLEFANLYKNIL